MAPAASSEMYAEFAPDAAVTVPTNHLLTCVPLTMVQSVPPVSNPSETNVVWAWLSSAENEPAARQAANSKLALNFFSGLPKKDHLAKEKFGNDFCIKMFECLFGLVNKIRKILKKLLPRKLLLFPGSNKTITR